MLTAAAVLVVLLTPVIALVGLLMAVEARQRAQARVIARQIMLTDAVHAELGAVVAPVVKKRAFAPWRVIFAIPAGHTRDTGRLISIANRVFAEELRSPNDVHIVFTRPAAA
jgi:hypothetical protein